MTGSRTMTRASGPQPASMKVRCFAADVTGHFRFMSIWAAPSTARIVQARSIRIAAYIITSISIDSKTLAVNSSLGGPFAGFAAAVRARQYFQKVGEGSGFR